MRIVVFEEGGAKELHPLTLTRPAFDLRCGAATLLERQTRSLPSEVSGAIVRPEFLVLSQRQHPKLRIEEHLSLDDLADSELVLLVNGRWLASERLAMPQQAEVGVIGEGVAYAAVPASMAAGASCSRLSWQLAQWRQTLPTRPASGALIAYPWDLIERNGEALEADRLQWQRDGMATRHGVSVSGPMEHFLAASSAVIEPLVHVDTSAGPVLLDEGAVVQAFSRLQGPCYVGKGTRVLGARVAGGSIGPECRIGGEVEASIVQGYSNKAHEGFLGHSYVGEWVNLAAGTQTSDLRTDYGAIRMIVDGKPVQTGLQKIGSFIGDHVKTSLNTLLNTGSLVGVFGQLLGDGEMLPRLVPSFCRYARGKLQERSALRELFTAAEAMMVRRGHSWTEAHADFFFTLFDDTAAERRQILHEGETGRRRRVI